MSSSVNYNIDHLLRLMQRLRDPDSGCPWDLQQNFDSIIPHTLEEVYEVVDAIERKDWPHVQEELGDLLFQIIFYAQLGQEQGDFQWSDVVQGIVEKLLRRHPHVFPDGTLDSYPSAGFTISEAEIKANWERIKAEEKALSGTPDLSPQPPLGDTPRALPALKRAQQLQQKAAARGFDWDTLNPVIAKLKEEITELEQALAEDASQDKLAEEMGDIFFSCVNLSRFLNIDPETATRQCNLKFERRFQRMSELLEQQGKHIRDVGLPEMEQCWDQAKLEGY